MEINIKSVWLIPVLFFLSALLCFALSWVFIEKSYSYNNVGLLLLKEPATGLYKLTYLDSKNIIGEPILERMEFIPLKLLTSQNVEYFSILERRDDRIKIYSTQNTYLKNPLLVVSNFYPFFFGYKETKFYGYDMVNRNILQIDVMTGKKNILLTSSKEFTFDSYFKIGASEKIYFSEYSNGKIRLSEFDEKTEAIITIEIKTKLDRVLQIEPNPKGDKIIISLGAWASETSLSDKLQELYMWDLENNSLHKILACGELLKKETGYSIESYPEIRSWLVAFWLQDELQIYYKAIGFDALYPQKTPLKIKMKLKMKIIDNNLVSINTKIVNETDLELSSEVDKIISMVGERGLASKYFDSKIDDISWLNEIINTECYNLIRNKVLITSQCDKQGVRLVKQLGKESEVDFMPNIFISAIFP